MVAVLLILVAATPEAGRAEFERGVELFRQQRAEEALPLLRTAHALSGARPAAALALAQCERALGLYADAAAHLTEYLASVPDAAERDAIRETIRSLRRDAAAAPSRPALTAPVVVEEEPRPWWQSPFAWGGALTVIAIVTTVAIVATSQEPPYSGTSGVRILAVSR